MSGLDKAEWVAQYEMLEAPLYNVVYRVIFDAAESQDIVQEAFLRCWQRRAEIRADGFRALLFRTALNLAISRRRRVRLWRFVGLADEGSGSSRDSGGGPAGETPADSPVDIGLDPTSDSILSRPVRLAFQALPHRWIRVLLLTEVAGLSYSEAALALGISEGTVGSRRSRALARLRDELGINGGCPHVAR